jgi:hypothetical protein
MSTLKVTNIKAADGTSSLSIANGTGVVGANKFTDLAGTGAPDFPNGLVLASNTTGGGISGVTLDDYEEGTWTPTIVSTVNLTSASWSVGRYTKVGRVVTLQGQFTATVTSSNVLTYASLSSAPFASEQNTTGSAFLVNNIATGITHITSSTVYPFFPVASAPVSGSEIIQFSITYTTAS